MRRGARVGGAWRVHAPCEQKPATLPFGGRAGEPDGANSPAIRVFRAIGDVIGVARCCTETEPLPPALSFADPSPNAAAKGSTHSPVVADSGTARASRASTIAPWPRRTSAAPSCACTTRSSCASSTWAPRSPRGDRGRVASDGGTGSRGRRVPVGGSVQGRKPVRVISMRPLPSSPDPWRSSGSGWTVWWKLRRASPLTGG